jgi:hypothetical protein
VAIIAFLGLADSLGHGRDDGQRICSNSKNCVPEKYGKSQTAAFLLRSSFASPRPEALFAWHYTDLGDCSSREESHPLMCRAVSLPGSFQKQLAGHAAGQFSFGCFLKLPGFFR